MQKITITIFLLFMWQKDSASAPLQTLTQTVSEADLQFIGTVQEVLPMPLTLADGSVRCEFRIKVRAVIRSRVKSIDASYRVGARVAGGVCTASINGVRIDGDGLALWLVRQETLDVVGHLNVGVIPLYSMPPSFSEQKPTHDEIEALLFVLLYPGVMSKITAGNAAAMARIADEAVAIGGWSRTIGVVNYILDRLSYPDRGFVCMWLSYFDSCVDCAARTARGMNWSVYEGKNTRMRPEVLREELDSRESVQAAFGSRNEAAIIEELQQLSCASLREVSDRAKTVLRNVYRVERTVCPTCQFQ